MPRPKFCVGEEVATLVSNYPDLDRAEIVSLKYVNNESCFSMSTEKSFLYTGYAYRVSGGGYLYKEDQVRKLPPEDRTSWEDISMICAWKPSDIREPVMVYAENEQ